MRRFISSIALIVALAAVGCERGGANAPSVSEYQNRRAAAVRAAQNAAQHLAGGAHAAQPSEPEPAGLTAGDGFSYVTAGRRDPFRSFVLEHKQRLAKQERGPLEQFDLNQLTVVAVVWDSPRPRALIEDPSGRSYVVQEGTAVGKNDGTVTRIGDNSVMVRETYVDYVGDATNKEIEMRVRTTQGG